MNNATMQLLGWAGARAAEAIADRVAERAARAVIVWQVMIERRCSRPALTAQRRAA